MTTSLVELKPLNHGGKNIQLPIGKTTVGRGPFFGCTDKRISRNHAVIEVTNMGKMSITPIHVNPCFVVTEKGENKELTKGVQHFLEHGHKFSLLPNDYVYEVIIHPSDDDVTDADTDSEKLFPTVIPPDSTTKRDSIVETQTTKNKNVKPQTSPDDLSSGYKPSTSEDSTTVPSTLASTAKVKQLQHRKRVLPTWLVDAALETDAAPANGKTPKRAPPRRRIRNYSITASARKSHSDDDDEDPTFGETPKQKTLKKRPDAALTTKTASAGKPKQLVTKPGAQHDVSDDESEPSQTTNKDVAATKKRSGCMYRDKCYRKNPAHREEFSHPGDDDYTSEPDDNTGDEPDDADDPRPECEYGLDCYRKNPQHRKDYKHSKRPARATAKKAKARLKERQSGDEDDEDENDSFIDDYDSDEYNPDSDEDDDDVSLLVKEAKNFKQNKKMMKPT